LSAAVLLAELSSGQKTGIALMGAAFIVFALACSILIPRYRPDFPGRHVAAFVAVSAGFFAAMILVIIFVAKEKEEPTAEAGTPRVETPVLKGDATAGKALFTQQGCSQCHTFTPAGSKGTVGPDLDHLAADAKKADRGSVEQYAHESIAEPGAYVVPGYSNGIMPPFGQTLKPKQIADLVAFVTSGSG
jgi:mono/diheme cytochrome c family protein